jgi:hemerythrin superfamily protein
MLGNAGRKRVIEEIRVAMDICDLIRADHEEQRLDFAHLDAVTQADEQRAGWERLRALLELHAGAEEAVFYPAVARLSDDAAEEIEDGVDEHNQLRDAIGEVAEHEPGTELYLLAIRQAKAVNDHHMAEEEAHVLPEVTRRLDASRREELGRAFQAFKDEHPGARGLSEERKDPKAYVASARS